MKNWEILVDEYLNQCRIRGLGRSTISTRETELLKWGRWLKKQKPQPSVEQIDHSLISKYIKYRTAFSSKNYVCSVMSAMRCMGEFLLDKGIWNQNPLSWMQSPKVNNYRKVPKTYHRSDLKKLFEESFNCHDPYFRSLYPAIISVFYTTGIRKGELLSLKLDDWKRTEFSLKVIGHKTGFERVVPVTEATWKCIENYLKARNRLLLRKGITSDFLFVNRNGDQVNGTTLHTQFRRLAKRAGIPKATIHMFRHSCATDLVEEGIPFPHVQKILGHSSSSSTYRYMSISDPQRKKAMQLHPINKILENIREVNNERV